MPVSYVWTLKIFDIHKDITQNDKNNNTNRSKKALKMKKK